MIYELKYWITVILFLFTMKMTMAQPEAGKLSVPGRNCLNFIHITGESNVNQFSFNFDQTNIIRHQKTDESDTGLVIIRIPIKAFKASNPIMYNDFLELMKAARYPVIEISFKRRQLDHINTGNYSSCPEIQITIAGVSHTYKIDCLIMPCAENVFLQGEKKLKLTDFNLKPPVKLKGLVKVSDDIMVNFGFMITFTEPTTLSTKL